MKSWTRKRLSAFDFLDVKKQQKMMSMLIVFPDVKMNQMWKKRQLVFLDETRMRPIAFLGEKMPQLLRRIMQPEKMKRMKQPALDSLFLRMK